MTNKEFGQSSIQWLGMILGIFILMAIVVNVMNRNTQIASFETNILTNTSQEILQENEETQSFLDGNEVVSPEIPGIQKKEDQAPPGEVIRKSFVTRGAGYTEHVFYRNGQEIARQSVSSDGKIEQTGEIPDGKVKFYDEYNNTQGEESYINGKRYGEAKAYYSDGRIKSEAKYINGRLVSNKEYYTSGVLRFMVNYDDAREYPGDSEVGVGKLYYPDGTLKYEWNITNSNTTGYKKSYNRDGQLRAEIYYDEKGNVIRSMDTLVTTP